MSAQSVIGGETNNIVMKYAPVTTQKLEDKNTKICKKMSGESFASFNNIQFKINMRKFQ